MIKEHLCWPAVERDTHTYIKSGHACQIAAPQVRQQGFGDQPVVALLHTFWMDFAGPFIMTEQGNESVLLAVEHPTGWPIMRAVRLQSSTTAIRFLERETFGQFGSPVVLDTANGPTFLFSA